MFQYLTSLSLYSSMLQREDGKPLFNKESATLANIFSEKTGLIKGTVRIQERTILEEQFFCLSSIDSIYWKNHPKKSQEYPA